jgi:ribonuclease T1
MNLSRIKVFCAVRLLPLLAFGLTLLLAPAMADAHSRHGHASSSLQDIALSSLPTEAKDTLRLIKQGGPFPYPRDGVVFGNYEKQLPGKQRGYYHEYTVKTPGVRNRGARRIVCGMPAECYYSDDHYQSFKLIRE